MPKLAKLDAIGAKLDLDHFKADPDMTDRAPGLAWRTPLWLRITGPALVLVLILGASFEFAYAGKIYPGVSADGVNLSGSDPADATQQITSKIATYQGEVIPVAYTGGTQSISVRSLTVKYDVDQAVSQAEAVGRQGSIAHRLAVQFGALIGGTMNVSSLSYDEIALASDLSTLDDNVVTPVADATVSFNGTQAQVNPMQTGTRLDLGHLTQLIAAGLATTSDATVNAPEYQLQPVLATGSLASALSQIDTAVAAPITVNNQGTTQTIDQNTIVSWMSVTESQNQTFLSSLKLDSLFPLLPSVNLGLSPAKVQAYVAGLAAGINQPAQNATLTWANNAVSVVKPSQDGRALDQQDAYNQIMTSLNRAAGSRIVNLKVANTPAAVNENNYTTLGITDQLSEGKTSYYWSPPARINNFSLGAARFNNYLLPPGQEFSFGQILGPATPAQGYQLGFVILANKEVPAYGGGLCQIVTTAYRAALLAGLPINERVNHAFAISYYTWPYGVPGVDATIYYPEVDLKFTNDTGHYILIQTNVNTSSNTVTYDFYGTKTKVGVIRGPYFVKPDGTTTSDPNYATAAQASHTVFYRDIEDLTGKVIHTDTINTYYKPSTDFPPESD